MNAKLLVITLLLAGMLLTGCTGNNIKTDSRTLKAPITIAEPVNVEVTLTPMPPFTIVEEPLATPIVVVEEPGNFD